MNEWPEEFQTFLVGMFIYFLITIVLFSIDLFFLSFINGSILEYWGAIMLFIALQSGLAIWNDSHEN
jgi:hypothetical protein